MPTPNSGISAHLKEIRISGGGRGMLIAVDLESVMGECHITEFPSQERMLNAQFLVTGDMTPEHRILDVRPCTWLNLAEL